jgi:hypothetical protein
MIAQYVKGPWLKASGLGWRQYAEILHKGVDEGIFRPTLCRRTFVPSDFTLGCNFGVAILLIRGKLPGEGGCKLQLIHLDFL